MVGAIEENFGIQDQKTASNWTGLCKYAMRPHGEVRGQHVAFISVIPRPFRHSNITTLRWLMATSI
jgi:hypothetical protein